MLVEDHPVNRAVLVAQIEAVGVVVDAAADADEAQRRFAEHDYGLVFTDIQLPGTDGYALAGRLRGLEAAHDRPRTPIVALTASAVRGEAERCRDAGMDDLVTKPTTLAVLDATLRRWMPQVAWPAAGGDGAPGAGASRVGPGAAPGGGPDAGGPADTGAGDGRAARPGVRSPSVFDASALDELTGGDPELGRQVLASYVEVLEADVEALVAARDAADPEGTRLVAHRMGSAGRMVGATAVAVAAEAVESAVLEGDGAWAAKVDAVAVAAVAVHGAGA
ncbi:response regulator [Patulibacter sp. NPDC049589]|uniref:response regulator n=1 Tax=Patulibacter sp. NPDC049589 TaxID=3154731 RepID=UPI0034458050